MDKTHRHTAAISMKPRSRLVRNVRPARRLPHAFARSATIVAALTSLVFCAASNAQLTPIASDGFAYPSGSLAGQNGGSGWTSAWTLTYGPGGDFDVTSSGLSYPGLTDSGGSIVWGSGGVTGISEDARSLPLQNSGIVYIQFLCQFGSSSGGGTPNIRLLNGGTLTGGFGANGGTFGGSISILDANLQPNGDGSSSSSASLSDLNLVIGRIDYVNNVTMMWVNPNLATFDYLNPTGANAVYDGLAPSFDSIAIYSRSPANLDELQIMAPVPEPTSSLLISIGVAAIVCGSRRRRRR